MFLALVSALMSTMMWAQDPVITFDKLEHNFGTIREQDGRVTTIFTFRNEGMSPLVLSNVRASCGCTTPKWPKQPIEPGESGEIQVTYNPNGRPGHFQKTITVTSNATEATKKLYIKGDVTPKPAKPEVQYAIKMGELNLKAKSLNFGTLKMGEHKSLEIEYANLTDHELEVAALSNDKEPWILTEATNPNIKNGDTGKTVVVLETTNSKLYGPVEADIYMMIGSKKILTDEYRIHISANIVEDFSNLTTEQLQEAPIVQVDQPEINLGFIRAGKPFKGTIKVSNNGTNPLMIRRILASEELKYNAIKSVKSGKNALIKYEINEAKPGKYTRTMTLITNDPKRPMVKVAIIFEVIE